MQTLSLQHTTWQPILSACSPLRPEQGNGTYIGMNKDSVADRFSNRKGFKLGVSM